MEGRNYTQEFHENFVVESIPDGQIHRYFTSFSFDCDKNEILSTAQLKCPYDKRIIKYWEPGRMALRVYGGVFDKELIFGGRVREIDQNGYEITLTCENIGWKLKQNVDPELVNNLVGQPVEDVVKALLKTLNMNYKVDLSGIKGVKNYVLDNGASIKYKNKTVEYIPELKNVIKNLEADHIDFTVAKNKGTLDTQTNADVYANKKQMESLKDITNTRNFYTPSNMRDSWTLNNNINLKTVKQITSKNDLEELSNMYVRGLNRKSSEYINVSKTYEEKSKILKEKKKEKKKKNK